MRYPLTLSFKILAVAPQLAVTDADGDLVFYVRQKLFKLKESVTVFADREQTRPLYTINADRVLDVSARYHFADARSSAPLGSVKRQGLKSLWKAHYDIYDGSAHVMTIQEENPWTRLLDGLFASLPLVGALSGYVFHPVYRVSRRDGTVVMRMSKQPAFFEGRFRVDKLAELSAADETRVLLSLLMMILLERARG